MCFFIVIEDIGFQGAYPSDAIGLANKKAVLEELIIREILLAVSQLLLNSKNRLVVHLSLEIELSRN